MGTIELIALPLCFALGFAIAAGWTVSVRVGYLRRIGQGVSLIRRVVSLMVPMGLAGLSLTCLFVGVFFLVTG